MIIKPSAIKRRKEEEEQEPSNQRESAFVIPLMGSIQIPQTSQAKTYSKNCRGLKQSQKSKKEKFKRQTTENQNPKSCKK